MPDIPHLHTDEQLDRIEREYPLGGYAPFACIHALLADLRYTRSRLAEAEGIIKALAEIVDPAEFYGAYDERRCFFCGAESISEKKEPDNFHHKDDCAWSKARAFCEAEGKGQ